MDELYCLTHTGMSLVLRCRCKWAGFIHYLRESRSRGTLLLRQIYRCGGETEEDILNLVNLLSFFSTGSIELALALLLLFGTVCFSH